MLREGDKVKVNYSSELMQMKLLFLCGQSGTVVKCQFASKTPGAYVYIEKGKSAGQEWYIPLQSIQSEYGVDKMRKVAMLKQLKI